MKSLYCIKNVAMGVLGLSLVVSINAPLRAAQNQDPEPKHRTRSVSLGSSTDRLRQSSDILRTSSSDKLRTSSERIPIKKSETKTSNSSSRSLSPSSVGNHLLPWHGMLQKKGGGYSPVEY